MDDEIRTAQAFMLGLTQGSIAHVLSRMEPTLDYELLRKISYDILYAMMEAVR